MSQRTDIPNASLFEGLFAVWEKSRFELGFYFREIFDKALAALKANVKASTKELIAGGEPEFKAMLVPVGFRIENVALISVLFSPHRLTMAFSETTRDFHRKHFDMVEEKIRQYCPSTSIDRILAISSEDHVHIEKKVIEWAKKMKADYGLSVDRLAIDLTGGTKPMSIGAQNAAASLGIPAFYLSVLYDKDTQVPIPGTESLVEMHSETDKNLVFVIMPFSDEFTSVHKEIEASVSEAGLQCVRVDQEIFSGGIMDKVRENVAKAGIIIAELSLDNTNVYYELGLAHAWNKKVIMITQDLRSIPFDLRHLRMVIYDQNDIDGLKGKLGAELAALKSV